MSVWRFATCGAALLAGASFAQVARVEGAAEKARRLEARLAVSPRHAGAVGELHLLLATPNDLSREESMRLRGVVREHGAQSVETLVADGEPGARIAISGLVRDEHGRPVTGALVTVFQTDARGFYSPRDAETKRMDEPNSRIFGFLRTGTDGRYEFRSVRPGGYPFPLPNRSGDQALVPAHIHFIVSAEGFVPHACGGGHSCQIVFHDDPRLTPHWQEWARKLANPVLRLQPGAAGILQAAYDVTLRRSTN